jgi:hypothetical protein
MEVKLVPSTILSSLEEYRGDENVLFGFFGLFLGALIGIFTSLATGGTFTSATWLVGIILGLATALTLTTAIVTRRRGNKAKKTDYGLDKPTRPSAIAHPLRMKKDPSGFGNPKGLRLTNSLYTQLGAIGPIQYRIGHIRLPTIHNSGTISLAFGNASTP